MLGQSWLVGWSKGHLCPFPAPRSTWNSGAPVPRDLKSLGLAFPNVFHAVLRALK